MRAIRGWAETSLSKFRKSSFPNASRAARAVAALNHPNICTLFDVGPNYLVMEYEDVGATLACVIKQEPAWDDVPSQVQRLLKACLEKDPKKRLRHIGDGWRLLEDRGNTFAPARSRLGWREWVVAAVAGVTGRNRFFWRERYLTVDVGQPVPSSYDADQTGKSDRLH